MPSALNSATLFLFSIKENDHFGGTTLGDQFGRFQKQFLMKKWVFIKQKKYRLIYPRYFLHSHNCIPRKTAVIRKKLKR